MISALLPDTVEAVFAGTVQVGAGGKRTAHAQRPADLVLGKVRPVELARLLAGIAIAVEGDGASTRALGALDLGENGA
ncbi:hypothetical protein, partial [Geminicoccus flavidas]|uniref:hypothetical protein n=1 Tax=Geminicoccus flavidas TaxID=2506407 RepID=UPI001F33A819